MHYNSMTTCEREEKGSQSEPNGSQMGAKGIPEGRQNGAKRMPNEKGTSKNILCRTERKSLEKG